MINLHIHSCLWFNIFFRVEATLDIDNDYRTGKRAVVFPTSDKC